MKGYNKLWALALIPMLASCADDFDTTSNFQVDKPESVAQYEYLNAYAPLKSYVDRNAHPGFLLGTGVSADDYLKRGGVYLLTNSNFDQVTTGNAMKYASIVGDDGTMDFSKVVDFVDAATAAGLQVYGHTLCWHAQQNIKWLNSLIADREVEGGGEPYYDSVITNGDGATDDVSCFFVTESGDGPKAGTVTNGEFVVNVGERTANDWDSQFFIRAKSPLQAGDTYRFSMKVKTTAPRSVDVQAHGEPGAYHHWTMCAGGFNATEEWTVYECEGSISGEQAGSDGCSTIAFNLSKEASEGAGAPACVFTFKDIQWEVLKTPAAKIPVSLITNGDVSSDDVSCFFGKENQGSPAPATIDKAEGAFVVHVGPKVAENYDNQFFIKAKRKLAQGEEYTFRMKVKCTDPRSVPMQAHRDNPGSYVHWTFAGGSFNATSEWTEYEYTGVVDASAADCDIIAMSLSDNSAPCDIWFKDIEWTTMESANSLPLTPEEKAEILTNEMERWVKGMMEATEGKVKAWDVVNEPLADGGSDASGKRGLKTDENVDENAFLWQKYLGENYVRVPIKFARKYFVENGGNADDLKLFINDYNLEAGYDNNFKAESLVKWVEQWESDGVTKIDGIGTQMHVSCSVDPEKQAKNEAHVVRMYEILARSGKLIRITELDMGITDENDKAIKTPDLTMEQKMLMSDYYKFIVKKYFEIIPVEQQYGICAWAQTDSPEGSGWRPGEPIGLWDENLSRKPAYGGFADGLAGKE